MKEKNTLKPVRNRTFLSISVKKKTSKNVIKGSAGGLSRRSRLQKQHFAQKPKNDKREYETEKHSRTASKIKI